MRRAMILIASAISMGYWSSNAWTCSETCVRTYCVTVFNNNVGVTWFAAYGILEELVDPNDYGTSCHGNGPAVQLIQNGGPANCAKQPGLDLYSGQCQFPGMVMNNVVECQTCQYGG